MFHIIDAAMQKERELNTKFVQGRLHGVWRHLVFAEYAYGQVHMHKIVQYNTIVNTQKTIYAWANGGPTVFLSLGLSWQPTLGHCRFCLLYTSDAADE